MAESQFKSADKINMSESEKQFNLEWSKFWDGWELIRNQAKEEAPENHGYSCSFRLGIFEASIEYSPPVIRYSKGGRNQKEATKPATLEDVQAIVAEYPDTLSFVERTDFFYITSSKYPFEDWQKVMNKVNEFKGGNWANKEGETKKGWVLPKK